MSAHPRQAASGQAFRNTLRWATARVFFVVVLIVALHSDGPNTFVAAECNVAAVESNLGNCNAQCCGSSVCECQTRCVGDACVEKPFSVICQFHQCRAAAIRQHDCVTDSAYGDLYGIVAVQETTCLQHELTVGCPLTTYDLTDSCIKNSSCYEDNTALARCSVSCYAETIKCHAEYGCDASRDAYTFCGSLLTQEALTCYACTLPTLSSGTVLTPVPSSVSLSTPCEGHYRQCQDAVLTIDGGSAAPTSEPKKDDTTTTILVAVIVTVVAVVLFGIVIFICLVMRKKNKQIDGRRTRSPSAPEKQEEREDGRLHHTPSGRSAWSSRSQQEVGLSGMTATGEPYDAHSDQGHLPSIHTTTPAGDRQQVLQTSANAKKLGRRTGSPLTVGGGGGGSRSPGGASYPAPLASPDRYRMSDEYSDDDGSAHSGTQRLAVEHLQSSTPTAQAGHRRTTSVSSAVSEASTTAAPTVAPPSPSKSTEPSFRRTPARTDSGLNLSVLVPASPSNASSKLNPRPGASSFVTMDSSGVISNSSMVRIGETNDEDHQTAVLSGTVELIDEQNAGVEEEEEVVEVYEEEEVEETLSDSSELTDEGVAASCGRGQDLRMEDCDSCDGGAHEPEAPVMVARKRSVVNEMSDRDIIRHLRMEVWSRGKFLGRGTNGSVYVTTFPNGFQLALKEIDLSAQDEEELKGTLDEYKRHKSLRHPNLVTCYAVGYDPERKLLEVWLELMRGGNLSQLVNRFAKASEYYGQVLSCDVEPHTLVPEDVVAPYVRQFLSGLKYLHEQHIVHGDIKGSNVMLTLDELTAKLCDLGTARVVAKTRPGSAMAQSSSSGEAGGSRGSQQFCSFDESASLEVKSLSEPPVVVGTPQWMAPELIADVLDRSQSSGPGRLSIDGKPTSAVVGGRAQSASTRRRKKNQRIHYRLAADVWSVGITVAELLLGGVPPYPDFESGWGAIFALGTESVSPTLPWSDMSPQCADFLKQCLVRNPMDRPTVEVLLQHPWLRDL